MACGIPCVTTRVGDAESLVGAQGIVVPVGDDLAMARAVSRLLGETAQARADRSGSARSRICARFSVQALARSTEARLLDLASSPAATCPDPGRP